MALVSQLSLIPELAPAPVFDGATYEAAQDGARLLSQLDATRELLLDREWRNLPTIALALRKMGLSVTEPSISARLRDLRKLRFGGFDVQRRRVAGGQWEYRIAPPAEVRN